MKTTGKPYRNVGDIVPATALLYESRIVDAWEAEGTKFKLSKFIEPCCKRGSNHSEIWEVECVGGPMDGVRLNQYVHVGYSW